MTLEKCRTCRGCHTCSRFRVTCTLVVIGEAHLAMLCDHSRSRLSWFWNCFLCARPHHLPLRGEVVGLVATSLHATASPLQASYDLRPFFKFACLTRDTIESCLLRLGIEAEASVGHFLDCLALMSPLCREGVMPIAYPTSCPGTYPAYYNAQAKAMSQPEFCPTNWRTFRYRVGQLGANLLLHRLVRAL